MSVTSAVTGKYRLYIDETGDHSLDNVNTFEHRYLSLLGVWLAHDAYISLVDKLEQLKREVFGPRHHPDEPIILHRYGIVHGKGPFGLLKKDEQKRQHFDEMLLDLIEQTRFKMISVIIDKLNHVGQYYDPWHPYHYCIGAILDRYSGWLHHCHVVGDVVAESRGSHDRALKKAFEEVCTHGRYSMFDGKFHRDVLTSQKIKMKKKKDNIAGLQLADVLVLPVKMHLLAKEGIIAVSPDNFSEKLYNTAFRKFNVKTGTGQLRGYGYVIL